ncbi:MAG TPA: glycosyltransferase [Syntrophales bacterium]|nr:glycosyltransferase [Syntrophales bacterium]
MAERAKALSRYIHLDIVAPIAYRPLLTKSTPPMKEIFAGLDVFHPRYVGLPSFLWRLRWVSYFSMFHSFYKHRMPENDIVHIEWIYPDAYAFLRYASRFHIKTIGVVHGNEAIGYCDKKSHRRYYIEALQRMDRIIAVSADIKRKMKAEYEIEEEKIVVIPNGADLTKFPLIDKFEARRILGLPCDEQIGVCVARLSPEKNLDVLIEALSLLGADAPKLFLIGDGPLKNALEERCRKHSVQERIIFVGPVPHEEIYQWLNAADFFCLPSQREGCPVVIHEALACGVPVVATTVGAVPEQISCDDYGLLCPPSDPKSLSVILARASQVTWDRQKIAAYGRRFTWDAVAQQTVKVFEEVLG